jgi:hypothetical protein
VTNIACFCLLIGRKCTLPSQVKININVRPKGNRKLKYRTCYKRSLSLQARLQPGFSARAWLPFKLTRTRGTVNCLFCLLISDMMNDERYIALSGFRL